MLRPKQMSKVSVAGARSYMPEVIETVHEINLVHLSDYDGSWEGFDNGNPITGAEQASEKLVTVRSLENTLDLDEAEDLPVETVTESELDDRLDTVRTDVNELDDRRSELRDQRREVQDRLDRLEPFAELGIELDLLSGYDSIDVAVGQGDEDELRAALEAAEEVRAFELFSGDGVVGLFAAPAEGASAPISDALVGVEFTRLEIPDAEGSPQSEISGLSSRKQQLESELESVEAELESLRHEYGGFLLAAERFLTVEVNRAEAPLRFATTERAFVAEGWIPSEQYDELVETLDAAVGDHVEVEEINRVDYDEHAEDHHDGHGEADEEAASDGPSPADTDSSGQQRAVTDGGTTGGAASGGAVTMDTEPPVVQDNPALVNPFEVLVAAVNRPKYSEFDPTITLFLTFPLFFGFMIGDIGYGLLYVLIGYGTYKYVDSKGLADFGAVVAYLGIATIIFGFFYAEVFGLKLYQDPINMYYNPFGDGAWFSKGLTETSVAIFWVVTAAVVGVFHLALAWVFEFIEEFRQHGAKTAVLEVGSWLLMIFGFWIWVFSAHLEGGKPDLLFNVYNDMGPELFQFGFTGFSETVGIAAGVVALLGLVMLVYEAASEAAEVITRVLVHSLSYTRLTAVLLSKGGMALAANLLYFGAYQTPEGDYVFMHVNDPGNQAVIFDGLFNMGLAGVILGIPVLIAGHLVVLAVGGTAMLQAIRLEYVEFFEKFYEGGGKKYEPFGTDRS